MKTLNVLILIIFSLLTNYPSGFSKEKFYQEKNVRLIILADMGNEPDEEQQMIHMLTCSNEFALEGLIAVTGKYLKTNPRPDLFLKLINGYEQVFENLKLHAKGWHTPDYLRSITVSGQGNYGMEDVGPGKSTPGSKLIVKSLDKSDDNPIWIVVNAGSNTLAQALIDYQESHTEIELKHAIAKLRVFENGAQDNAGAWICKKFPSIHWIRSNYQTYAYGGPGGDADGEVDQDLGPFYWEPFDKSASGQNQWLDKNVRKGHGELGALYPERYWGNWGYGFMEGGGTIPWIGLANKGLFNIDQPNWGGWGGRFTAEKVPDVWSRHTDVKKDELQYAPFFMFREVSDTWTDPKTKITYCNDFAPVWRWRKAMYNNQKCRMDWCVKPYSEANHHPVAVLFGNEKNKTVHVEILPGDTLKLDASNSYDPDGDSLLFSWWQYAEAGTYPGTILIHNSNKTKSAIIIPSGAAEKKIHLILEVQDTNTIGPLFDYRRVVIDVLKHHPHQ